LSHGFGHAGGAGRCRPRERFRVAEWMSAGQVSLFFTTTTTTAVRLFSRSLSPARPSAVSGVLSPLSARTTRRKRPSMRRSAECDIRMEKEHTLVSRKHAQFFVNTDGQSFVTCLGSRTLEVNNEVFAKGEHAPLRAGDIVTVSHPAHRFSWFCHSWFASVPAPLAIVDLGSRGAGLHRRSGNVPVPIRHGCQL
jgi:FHA domain